MIDMIAMLAMSYEAENDQMNMQVQSLVKVQINSDNHLN